MLKLGEFRELFFFFQNHAVIRHVPVFRCFGVSVFRCSGIPVVWCSGVPVFRCSIVPDFNICLARLKELNMADGEGFKEMTAYFVPYIYLRIAH